MNGQKEIIFMIGIPGCGKSTYVNNNFKHYTVLSLDDIRFSMGFTYNKKLEPIVLTTFNINLQAMLHRGINNIVLDNTNLDLSLLEHNIDLAQEYGYNSMGYLFNTPYDICYGRRVELWGENTTNKVLHRMNEKYKYLISNNYEKLYELFGKDNIKIIGGEQND